MAQLGRDGHRGRVKQAYLQTGIDSLHDHNILELLLFYAIPRKDVKDIAYELINKFGSFENVFEANIDDLMSVKGVGENTAVLISLVSDINNRISLNKNSSVKALKNSELAREYVKNIIGRAKNEKVLVISLDNELGIIGSHIVSDGTVSCANVEPKKIIECVIKDNAASVIIAHNHPKGDSTPSDTDIAFTIEILQLLRKLGVKLNDHIIVGKKDICSMNSITKYMLYFE